MKIRILRAHYVDGMGGVAEGQIIDVPEYEAKHKITIGHAAPVDDVPPAKGVVHLDESAIKPKPTPPATINK